MDGKVRAQSSDELGAMAKRRIVIAGFPHASIASHEILSTFRQSADVTEIIGWECTLENGPDEILFRSVMSVEEMKWLVRVKNARDTLNQFAEKRRSRSPRRDDQNPFHCGNKSFVIIHVDQGWIQKWRDFAFSHGLLDSNGSNTLGYPEIERIFSIRLMCRLIFFEKVHLRTNIYKSHRNQKNKVNLFKMDV
jgi:hypothetical protein